MKMKKVQITKTNEELFYDKLENGLELYILPNNNQKNFYITFSTKFGSINTEFKCGNETTFKKVPNGIAHYLEHLKFNTKDGSAFEFFYKLGASVNAFTSYDLTCYEVYSSTFFKENLNYLLDYVQTPYFNKELVDNERGIITEEIKMYENNPNTELTYAAFKNIFIHDLRKNLISGTKEDINKIRVEHIFECYNTFYNPNNMFIIITGKVDPYEALAIIVENQKKKEFINKTFHIKKINEPLKVKEKYKEIFMNVETNKVSVSYKIPKKNFKKINISNELLSIYFDLLFNLLFDSTSSIQDKLISSKVIQSGININKTYTDDYIVVNLTTDTDYPELFIKMIREEIENMNIQETDFIRKIKVIKSNYLLHFDDIELVNSNIQDNILLYGKFIDDYLDLCDKLTFNKLKEIVKQLKTKTESILIIKPNC